MADFTIRDLLEAGTHFGHQTKRWNPKMRPYIFTERNGIHIIDLQKTVGKIEAACETVRKTVRAGKTVLFVSTKKQGRDIVREEAERCGMSYVTERWLGGMLTNWQTIRQSISIAFRQMARMRSSRKRKSCCSKRSGGGCSGPWPVFAIWVVYLAWSFSSILKKRILQ